MEEDCLLLLAYPVYTILLFGTIEGSRLGAAAEPIQCHDKRYYHTCPAIAAAATLTHSESYLHTPASPVSTCTLLVVAAPSVRFETSLCTTGANADAELRAVGGS